MISFKKGGAENVRESGRQREYEHVVSNALLPGMLYGWSALLRRYAPQNDTMLMLESFDVCHVPGSLGRKFPGSFLPGAKPLTFSAERKKP